MTSIREIFSTFGPEYLQRYATTMPKIHRKVLHAIIACRTETCGIAFYRCDSCAEPRQFYRSCGNRHCPAANTPRLSSGSINNSSANFLDTIS